MTTPVTRGELRAEMAALEDRFDKKLEARLAVMATKADLEIWGGALLAEIGRHTKAVLEAMSTQISVIDDKYKDLPARVSHLEATLLPPKLR